MEKNECQKCKNGLTATSTQQGRGEIVQVAYDCEACGGYYITE